MTRLVAVGLGYSAQAIAARLASDDWQIAGTARTEDGLAAIRSAGYEALPFDGEAPSAGLRAALGEATHLILSAPPGADGDPFLLHHRRDLEAAPRLAWIGYLSTIGVYGDHGGAWIDEDTPPEPLSPRNSWRIAAETAWQDVAAARGIPAAIFRLAGIYGPGRNSLLKLKAGTERRIAKPGQVFNRIHLEDIAGAVEAAIAARTGGVFNIADDEPAPPEDVTAFAADLLGMAPPPIIDWSKAALSPMARSFWLGNRRIRNARMKDVLGYSPRYPSYREGLRALAAALGG